MQLLGILDHSGQTWRCRCTELALAVEGNTRDEVLEGLRAEVTALVRDRFDTTVGFELIVHGDSAVVLETERTDVFLPLILAQTRKASGLSLGDVCERLGLKSRGTLSQYELGRSEPSLRKLQEVMVAFGLDVRISLVPRAGRPH